MIFCFDFLKSDFYHIIQKEFVRALHIYTVSQKSSRLYTLRNFIES